MTVMDYASALTVRIGEAAAQRNLPMQKAGMGRGCVETRWRGSQQCSFRAIGRHRSQSTAIPSVVGTEGLSGAFRRRFFPV